ncbi:MAG: type II secretion system F family protein [Planctomycetes bacterium]|nr:type II secretion system F family protein [Planctomycetota bacterium]
MSQFIIEAIDVTGKKIQTKIEAQSQEDALKKVRVKGLKPVSCKELDSEQLKQKLSQSVTKKKKFNLFQRRVATKDLARFTHQFSVLINSGLPIVRCLKVLANQQKEGYLKEVLQQIAEDIEAGSSLSEVFSKHPTVFDKLYVNMVRAGEAGGILDEIMRRLSEYMEKMQKLKGKVISASIYPVVVLFIAVSVVLALMTFIVPKFQAVLTQLGGNQAMHPLTSFILGISDFIVNRWYLLIIIVGILTASTIIFFKSKTGKVVLDKMILRIPVFGALIRKFMVARICRTLGTLLKSGVPILDAITIVKNTTNNTVIEKTMDYLHTNVKEGESLTGPLSQSKIFDDLVVNMVDVGEESGQLDTMLLKVADIYDGEVDNTIGAISSLIEPILILLIGGIVGLIVMALFLPMMTLIKSFGTRPS